MTGSEFERKIRKVGRKQGVSVLFDAGHGKGGHGRLYYGNRFTTLRTEERRSAPAFSRRCSISSG